MKVSYDKLWKILIDKKMKKYQNYQNSKTTRVFVKTCTKNLPKFKKQPGVF